MFFIIKLLLSALIIAAVSTVAKMYPSTGGLIAALPLVSLLSLFWLKVQGNDPVSLSKFILSVTAGLPSTICMLLVIGFLIKSHSFVYSLAFGIASWGGFILLQKYVLHFLQH